MTRYGYACGQYEDQVLTQVDILEMSGIELDGGIVTDMPWIDFLERLQNGDEVVVAAKSRLSQHRNARLAQEEITAREEMLELLGVHLFSITQDGRVPEP